MFNLERIRTAPASLNTFIERAQRGESTKKLDNSTRKRQSGILSMQEFKVVAANEACKEGWVFSWLSRACIAQFRSWDFPRRAQTRLAGMFGMVYTVSFKEFLGFRRWLSCVFIPIRLGCPGHVGQQRSWCWRMDAYRPEWEHSVRRREVTWIEMNG